MRWKVVKRKGLISFLLAVAFVSMTGCTAIGNEDVPEPVTPQMVDTEGLSEATRALRAAGYADPYLDVEPTGVVREFEFWVDENVVLNPHGDRGIWSMGFTDDPEAAGTVPGPEIRVRQGDTVRVTLHTPDSGFPGHTIHWHGVDVPWSSDGVPFTTQEIAGPAEAQAYTYEFIARQPGTYWYHCVTAFPVDIDVGLFGALIVEPQNPGVDLPADRDEVLVFHEMDSQWLAAAAWTPLNPNQDPNPGDLPSNPVDLVDSVVNQGRTAADVAGQTVSRETGESIVAEGPREYYPESSPRYKPEYDTFMINGKSYPDTEPLKIREGETLRLRLINAGQLHKSIHLHGHKMLVTHVDGYPLDHPHFEDTLHLAPGERKDVYVQGTNPGIWSFHDHSGQSGMGSTSTNDRAFPGGMKTVLVYEDFEPQGHSAKPGDGAVAGDFAVYAPSYRSR